MLEVNPEYPFYQHQKDAREFARGRSYYALLMEQGTGKTPVEIVDAADRFVDGEIDALLITAPNGVQTNWVRREIPKHIPHGVPHVTAAWTSGTMTRKRKAEMEALWEAKRTGGKLQILAMNYESLTTNEGAKIVKQFCSKNAGRLKITTDESQRIKSPKAERSKAMHKLRVYSNVRSILSGSPILNSPWDAFSQFSWLNKKILRTDSFAAFRAEYAHLLPDGHGLLRHLQMRMKPGLMARFRNDEKKVDEYLRQYKPQIVATDEEGRKRWRNLDQLESLIAPHSFRVLKKDCLDLPEKIYTRRFFAMNPLQRKMYDRLAEEFRIMLMDTDMPIARLTAIGKMSQLASGFFIIPNTDQVERVIPIEKNPRLAVLKEELESCFEAGEQVIVWARYQEELREIAAMVKKEGWNFGEYHGSIGSKAARQQAIDDFEAGRLDGFLSQQAAGGTGLTLVAPNCAARTMSVIYYSNTYALDDRIQSEDRAHRIGQAKSVRYVDICAEDSCDETILDALAAKKDVAAIVTGDKRRAAELLLNFQ